MSFNERITDLSGNLDKHPITDDIILKKNEDAIKQHVNLLLLGDEFSCIGRPYLCANLRKYINELATDSNISEIETRVRDAMRHERRAGIQELTVDYDFVKNTSE